MLTVHIVPVPSNHSTATSRHPFMTRDACWWNIWPFRKALTLPWSCYFLKGHPGSLFLGYHPSSPFLLHMLRSLFLLAVSIALGCTVARGYRTLTPCILHSRYSHCSWETAITCGHSKLTSCFQCLVFPVSSQFGFGFPLNPYKTLFFLRTPNLCGRPVFQWLFHWVLI